MKTAPEGCFNNSTDRVPHKIMAKVLLTQVTNQTGTVCQVSVENGNWTMNIYQRFCCKMADTKNMECTNTIIFNKWLGLFNLSRLRCLFYQNYMVLPYCSLSDSRSIVQLME